MNIKAHLFSMAPVWMPKPRGVLSSFPAQAEFFLTFDDGPHPVSTPAALSALSREKMRATFFMTGDAIRRSPEAAREVASAGHAAGNHAMTHRRMRGLSTDQMRVELRACNSLLEASSFPKPDYFRPPHGWFTPRLAAAAGSEGMGLLLWNRMPCDYDERIPLAEIRGFLSGRLRAGDVLVLHDNERTASRVDDLVSLVAELASRAGLLAAPLPARRERRIDA